jgi:hypothetical protein
MFRDHSISELHERAARASHMALKALVHSREQSLESLDCALRNHSGRIRRGARKTRGGHHKNMVFALVERGGRVRAKHVISGREFNQIKKTLVENVSPEARLSTDEARMY